MENNIEQLEPIQAIPPKPKKRRFSVWHLGVTLVMVVLTIVAGFMYLPKVHASTYTWDGGGGDSNWSTPGNWSTDTAPLATDSVIFDNSLCGVNCNATIDAGFQGTVVNLTIDATYGGIITEAKDLIVTGDFSIAGGTFNAVSYTISVGGNYGRTGGTFTAGTSTLKMTSTATGKTFTAGGQTYNNLTFDGVGGGWTLQDALTLTTVTGALTLTKGTLDTNNQTVSIGSMNWYNGNVKTLTLGSSAITITGAQGNTVLGLLTNTTVTANTAIFTFIVDNGSINVDSKNMNGSSLVFTGGRAQILNGGTFNNVTVTGTAVKTNSLFLSGNPTVTGTLTLNGDSPTNRLLVYSNTLGTARTLTAAAVSLSNVDFMDITAAGAAIPFTGTSMGDAGGNSNITFDDAVTQTWNGTTGSWSDNTKWTSRVPLPQDDVVLAGTNIVTADMPRIGKSISFSAAARLTLGNAVTSYGSLNFTNSGVMTGNFAWTLGGRGSYLLTSAGKTFSSVSMQGYGGSLTAQDATSASGYLSFVSGLFDLGPYSVASLHLQPLATPIAATAAGSGAITLSGTNLHIQHSGLTWNHTGDLNFAYAGASNQERNFGTSRTIPNNINITGGGAGIAYLQATTAATFTGKVTVNAPKTVKFTSAVTYNFADISLNGSAGNVITMLASTGGSAATLNYTGTKRAQVVYGSITDINVTPASTWYYDENSTWNSGTGWETDWEIPTAPAYVSVAPTGYSALNSFEFTWPVVPPDGPTDAGGSELWKYQYRVGTSGDWTDIAGDETTASVTLTDAAALGLNTFNLVILDNIGNRSNSVRTNFYFNDTAPTAPPNLTVTPLTNTVNEFAFDWDASPGEIAGYYYSVNDIPTLQNANWTTSTSLSANAYATQQGENLMYVVAKDSAGNYDFSGCGPGSVGYNPNTDICAAVAFSASTTAPGLPGNLQAFDISNRATQEYTVALKWDAPTAPGTGLAGYDIYRSENGIAYVLLGDTTGTTYADNNVISHIYFYKLKSRDNADQTSAFTSPIFITPTGAFTTAPVLVSGPTFVVNPTSIEIAWATDREASSLVTIKEGNTFVGEQGQTEQVTAHSVKVVGLRAQNEYTFTISSTDIDGNTMTGSEQTFTTANTPAVYDLNLSNLTQSSIIVNFKSTASANFTLYYGESTDYGETTAEATGSATTNHSLSLADLKSGQAYFFRVLGEDADGNELRSENSFTTLPMPEISDFKIEPVKDAPSTTLKVTWKSNVATSTILKYSADGSNFSEKDLSELSIDHEIIVEDLQDSSRYVIFGAGRDQFGNMATSNQITFDTPADSRAPEITAIVIESSNVGNISNGKAQIAVSWKTDEAASSQVEYDTGISGEEYTKKTVVDGAFTNQHLVIISDLDPGKPYHLRVVSSDMSGNETKSNDNTVITGDVSKSALQLILDTLMRIFGWMGKLIKQ